ncbi:MarR family winged helix-turn-helix transcriptional regulator [Phaeovulum sp. W22_SRMD_FR3]|uniref:MarR family winged helix-turn-helix transcriptional regulator n=1 Tax=Phaeovulum sp. W22_SRMD_FR3 TaxID=3240274 RepID=UPI003F9A6EDF
MTQSSDPARPAPEAAPVAGAAAVAGGGLPSANQSLDASMRPEVLQVSDVMRRWRVLIGRRIISRRAIANVDPRIDLSHVDVLDVVRQLQQDSEATVGGVARAMRIDPSRGSRIIADMVEEGLLLRDVSAQDSRRAVIRRSALGEALQAELRKVKMALLEDILGEWAPGEAEEFARLFAKFVTAMEAASGESSEGCAG